MWKSRNKTELIIEVWEKLDCENVGACEIEAIEIAVADVFGKSAVESPMKIARLLADEGAELRHSEIMELYVTRASDRPYDAAFTNLIETADLRTALRSIRQMENLRRKFASENDREGLRLLREQAIAEKQRKLEVSSKIESAEIAEWLNIWLKSPEVFDTWVKLRLASADFKSRFGEDLKL